MAFPLCFVHTEKYAVFIISPALPCIIVHNACTYHIWHHITLHIALCPHRPRSCLINLLFTQKRNICHKCRPAVIWNFKKIITFATTDLYEWNSRLLVFRVQCLFSLSHRRRSWNWWMWYRGIKTFRKRFDPVDTTPLQRLCENRDLGTD